MVKSLMFILPRFHTNLYVLVKELRERGLDISLLAGEVKYSENHSGVMPIITGYARVVQGLGPYQTRVKFGIPPLRYFKTISNINPDVIILKNFNFKSLYLSIILRLLRYRVVIYTQTPIEQRLRFTERLYRLLFGDTVFTPCTRRLGDEPVPLRSNLWQKWHYVPFVAEVNEAARHRTYFKDGYVNILVVAKYQKRKMILEFLDTFRNLADVHQNLRLTIAGTTQDQSVYEKVLEQCSTISDTRALNSVPHEGMNVLYMENDIFVLPSMNEPASYSQLEAMGNGLAVICCSSNGTAHYVKNGYNGYLFSDKRFKEDLTLKLNELLRNKSVIPTLGANGIKTVESKHNADRFCAFLAGLG